MLLLVLSAVQATPAPAPDEVVVTGRALPPPPGTPAFGAVTIGRERLEGVASGRLEDVLRDVAGFGQFRRSDSRSANPTAQGVTLRALGGNGASRALVLLDGVPVADPFTGFIPFAALAPERLGRVRVTRGGGSGPFGAGALAGVIELESAGPDEVPLLARGLLGRRDAAELAVAGTAPLGGGHLLLGGRLDRGDGAFIVPADQRGPADVPARYRSWSLSARAAQALGPDVELQASGLLFDDERRRGLPGARAGTGGGDFSLRAVARGGWGAEALAYLQRRDLRTRFVSASADRRTATVTLDQFATPATGWGGKLELRPPVGGGHVLRIGADLRGASGETRERFAFVGGAPTRARVAGGAQVTAGLFVEDDWTLGRLTLTGGARLDWWRIADGRLREAELASGVATRALAFPDRDGAEPTARAGALWRVSDGLSLRGAAYTGWRLPTLNELYRPFRLGPDATAANAALRPERLAGVEAGLDARTAPGVRLGLTLFANRLENAIANVTLGRGPGTFPQVGFVGAGGAFRQRLNLQAIRVRGVEVTAEARRGPWSLLGSAALSDPRVEASGVAAGLDGLRPAQSPRVAASGTLAWSPAGGARVAGTVRYVGTQFEDDENRRRLPGVATVDGVATVPLGRGVKLMLRGENLLGARVVAGLSAAGVEEIASPRTIWMGVSVTPAR